LKHVEESNNIWRINNIQCITLVVLYGGTETWSWKVPLSFPVFHTSMSQECEISHHFMSWKWIAILSLCLRHGDSPFPQKYWKVIHFTTDSLSTNISKIWYRSQSISWFMELYQVKSAVYQIFCRYYHYLLKGFWVSNNVWWMLAREQCGRLYLYCLCIS